jgi:hypothetical protein
MRMAHCSGLRRPKNGCGCWEQQLAPLLAKLSIAAMSWARSRPKSHRAGSAGKSSGEEGEFRRIGLSSPRTRGLISAPRTLAGKDARLGLMTPIAICTPEVQCARVWARDMLPQCRTLSGSRRKMRCLTSSTNVGSKRFFTVAASHPGGLSGRGPDRFLSCAQRDSASQSAILAQTQNPAGAISAIKYF